MSGKDDEVPQLIYDTLKGEGKVTKLSVLADKVGMNTGTLKLYLESDELKDKIHVWTTDNVKWVNIPRGGTITDVGGDRKSSSMITTVCEDCENEFDQSKMGRRSVRCPDCKEKRRLDQLRNRGKSEEEVDEVEDEGDESGEEEEVEEGSEDEVEGDESGEEEEVEEGGEIEVRGIEDSEDAQSRLLKLRTDTMVEWVKHRIDEMVVDHILDQEMLEMSTLPFIKKVRELPDELKDKFSE